MAAEVDDPTSIEAVIEYMRGTEDASWCEDVVRTEGGANCFFGHLFNMGRDEREANRIWDWFENAWATTYRVYPVNDGKDPSYQQDTPKERVIAFLEALAAGKEDTTWQSMDRYFQMTEAELANG
jgi:hypothetical protein